MKTLVSVLLIITFSNLTIAQTTAIPDANFEQVLINLGYDTGVPDGIVNTNNIDTVTFLDVGNDSIMNLIGIEDFIALEHLDCRGNLLNTLNVTQNISLKSLLCQFNQLTSLNVTQNTLLTGLICSYNQLSSIDVTQNSILTELLCGGNEFTSLDVTQNIALTNLQCTNNELTNLDISQNIGLIVLHCASNSLTTLNLTQNTSLEYLVSHNNEFTSLDVTQNIALVYLHCQFNQLTCLNIKNGFNNNINHLYAKYNPDLTCIEVDNVSNSNWTNIDAQTSFSTNCNNSCSETLCTMVANYSFIDNGNGNYSFTNFSTGNYSLMDWNFGDGISSSLTNPNHAFLTNGSYTVVLAIADSSILTGSSCIDYHYATINVTGVSAPLQCNAGFVMYPDTSSNDITVVNSSTGNNLTYSWDFGDGNTSNIQNPSHTYTSQGTYYLCLTIDDGNGCIDSYCDSIGNNGVVFKSGGFKINVISPSAIGIEENNLSELAIYPNPTNGEFTIDLREVKQNVKATLTNSLGQVILTQNFTSTNFINLVIDAPKGVYLLQLESDREVITKKIIKE